MSNAYLDSNGNVNTAIADDVWSFVGALWQMAAVPLPSTQAAAVAAGTQLASDALTGFTNTAVTDV